MLLACVAIMVAALANYSIRDQQYRVWQSFPEITQMDDMPLFSKADAPYFLYHAETLRQKTDQAGQPPTMAQHRELPLLSVLLAYMATDSSKAALVRAGHWLNPVLAFLTAVMIALTFGVVGYWFEGAVAALGGGLSFAYLSRSSAGRIDTDQLNLGFFYLMFACAYWVGTVRGRWAMISAAVVMGAVAHLFYWWYPKPELIVMPLVGLIILQLFLYCDVLGAIVAAGLVVLLSDMAMPTTFDSGYIRSFNSLGGFKFPNFLDMISEVQTAKLGEILPAITGTNTVGFVCLLGLAMVSIRHPVVALAYAPLAGFALLNAFIGNRALFYSAPAFWFGGAYLCILAARYVWHSVTVSAQVGRPLYPAVMMLFALLVTAYASSAHRHIPKPSFSVPVVRGFAHLRDLPANAMVASWWDYGHLSQFMNRRKVLHGGGGR